MAINFVNFEYEGERSDILDNAFVLINYENGVRARFDLCMFSPMFYEELIICGDEGRLRSYHNTDFLPVPRAHTHLEIVQGNRCPSRISTPCYPSFIEESGHNGATFYEQMNFVDNIEGKETNTATAEEGFWSIVVGYAAEQSVKRGEIVMIDDLLAENEIEL
jgi:predicted dehydrogenase